MNRPLLTLAIVALLSAGELAVFYFRLTGAHAHLQAQLADTTARADTLSRDLNNATEQNGTLTSKATSLEAELGAVKSKLTAAETRATQLDHDLAQSKNLLSLQEQNTRALAAEVASLKAD